MDAAGKAAADAAFRKPILSRAETALLIAEDEVGVAGWVYGHELVHPDGEKTMMLYALAVAERARRRGVGEALVVGLC